MIHRKNEPTVFQTSVLFIAAHAQAKGGFWLFNCFKRDYKKEIPLEVPYYKIYQNERLKMCYAEK